MFQLSFAHDLLRVYIFIEFFSFFFDTDKILRMDHSRRKKAVKNTLKVCQKIKSDSTSYIFSLE